MAAMSKLRMEEVPLNSLHAHPDNDYPTSEQELTDLMESIRSDGMAQLPLVRPHGDGYQIIAGHRRVECYRRLAKEDPARWGRIPVNIMDNCDDARALILLDATNLMARQLSPSERAKRFERLWNAVPALRRQDPTLKGVRTSQVISDIITRETGQSISRASVDRALAAGRRAQEVSQLAKQQADALSPEWREEIKTREGFTPESVKQIAQRNPQQQKALWADYQRGQLTPRQLVKRLDSKAPKGGADVDRALDQVIRTLREVSAWQKKYGAEVDLYRIQYIHKQLDKLSPM